MRSYLAENREAKSKVLLRFNLRLIALFFLIPFCGYYITKLPVSPIYFTYALVLILFILLLAMNNIRFKMFDSYVLFCIVSLGGIQLLFTDYNESTLVNLLMSLSFLYVCMQLLRNVRVEYVIFLSKLMVVVSLPLLIFEAVYRFLNPINQERYIDAGREDIMFYIYKFNSVMYIDSNFVALYILSLLFFSFYINRYAPRTVSFFYVCILVFLLFSSISRAAIFSFLIFLFMLPFSSLIYKWRYYVMLFLPALLLFLFQIVFESSGFDDSLRSKFMILSLTVEYIKDIDPMTLLLGVGVGKAADVLGIGSHNIITTYLVELGLVGTSMISALWILIMIKSRYKAGIIMFPFLVCGLSLTTFAIPYLYAMFGIVYHIERDRLYE